MSNISKMMRVSSQPIIGSVEPWSNDPDKGVKRLAICGPSLILGFNGVRLEDNAIKVAVIGRSFSRWPASNRVSAFSCRKAEGNERRNCAIFDKKTYMTCMRWDVAFLLKGVSEDLHLEGVNSASILRMTD